MLGKTLKPLLAHSLSSLSKKSCSWKPEDANVRREEGGDVMHELLYSYLHFPAVWAPGQRSVCELCPLELRRERSVTFSFRPTNNMPLCQIIT